MLKKKSKKPIKVKYKYVRNDEKLKQGYDFLNKKLKENLNKIKRETNNKNNK